MKKIRIKPGETFIVEIEENEKVTGRVSVNIKDYKNNVEDLIHLKGVSVEVEHIDD